MSISRFFILICPLVSLFADQSSYVKWCDKSSPFIEFLDRNDQARVIWMGSEAYSTDGCGLEPTSSVSMGCGLLLTLAHRDQEMFNCFCRYILTLADEHSCRLFSSENQNKEPLFMPSIVNQFGECFWYKDSEDAMQAIYSLSSDLGGDSLIALSLFIADQYVVWKRWEPVTFNTPIGDLSYGDVFRRMISEMQKVDNDDAQILFETESNFFEAEVERIIEACNRSCLTLSPEAAQHQIKDDTQELFLTFHNSTEYTLTLKEVGGNGQIELIDYSSDNLIPSQGEFSLRFKPNNEYFSRLELALIADDENEQSWDFCFECKDEKWQQCGATVSTSSLADKRPAMIALLPDGYSIAKESENELQQSPFEFQCNELCGQREILLNFLTTLSSNATPCDSVGAQAMMALLEKGILQTMREFINSQKENNPLIELMSTDHFSEVFLKELGEESLSLEVTSLMLLASEVINNPSLITHYKEQLSNFKLATQAPSFDDPAGEDYPFRAAFVILMTEALLEGLI